MVNKLRKTPPGTTTSSARGTPIGHAQPSAAARPSRSRSWTEGLDGLHLRASARAAATRVNNGFASLRRSGSARLKAVLARSHSAPPELGPQQVAVPLEPGGPPIDPPVLSVPSLPSLHEDPAAVLRSELAWAHLSQVARRPFDAVDIARERALAAGRGDAQALREQARALDGIHVSTLRVANHLLARFAGTPATLEIEALTDQVSMQVTREKLATLAALRKLPATDDVPPLPPRPGVHELP